ncbi:hypothetical protein B0J18DRAFT_492232 [Chaetomium sp. MPI-SDFR-AT-0129]|nr:hypothetical protein B0J18DRAFT_492232 [Chaetomium sp. MPI-SDFR-AT-0129]
MASVTSDAQVQQPPYPTYAAISEAKRVIKPNRSGLPLLYWPLNADTPATLKASGLAVMAMGPKHPDPDVLTPYWDASAGTWHPVSKQPISEPKVSEILVQMRDVMEWERTWKELHWECQLDDNRLEYYEQQGDGLCHGCGVPKPAWVTGDVSILVKGTGGGGEGEGEGGEGGGCFVTVHDYVSTVHPWMVGRRGDILGALGTSTGRNGPLAQETELMVRDRIMDWLSLEKREEWVRHTKKQPPPGWINPRRLMQPNGMGQLSPFGGFPVSHQGERNERD